MKTVRNKRVTSRSPPPPPIALLQDKYILSSPKLSSPKQCDNRVFSLTWPASMQIFWNKRKLLHKKGVQLPQDWFGTVWDRLRRFIVLGHQYGRRDVMWKRSIESYIYVIISPIAREEVERGLVLKMFWILNQPWFTQNVVVMNLVISLMQNLFLYPPLPQANSCLFLVRWWYYF